jgi:hypothetical protein
MPVGAGFVNWRDETALQRVQEYQVAILQGIWNDIDPHQEPYFALNTAQEWEHVTPTFSPRLWSPTWGPVPQDKQTAYAVLGDQLARAPRLIPIWFHRCIPDRPQAAGNPVYSIVQTDIISYGNDLADYLYREFGVPRPVWAAAVPREIPFWSELVRLNNG